MGLCCVRTGQCAGHLAPPRQDAAVAGEPGEWYMEGHMLVT